MYILYTLRFCTKIKHSVINCRRAKIVLKNIYFTTVIFDGHGGQTRARCLSSCLLRSVCTCGVVMLCVCVGGGCFRLFVTDSGAPVYRHHRSFHCCAPVSRSAQQHACAFCIVSNASSVTTGILSFMRIMFAGCQSPWRRQLGVRELHSHPPSGPPRQRSQFQSQQYEVTRPDRILVFTRSRY